MKKTFPCITLCFPGFNQCLIYIFISDVPSTHLCSVDKLNKGSEWSPSFFKMTYFYNVLTETVVNGRLQISHWTVSLGKPQGSLHSSFYFCFFSLPYLIWLLIPKMRCMETWVPSLGWEDPLEKGKATHSSILAWRILWIIQSMGSQRVGHNWATFTHSLTHMLLSSQPLNYYLLLWTV